MVKVTQKFLQCRTMDFLLSHLVRNTIGWIPLQPNKHVKALVWQATHPLWPAWLVKTLAQQQDGKRQGSMKTNW